MNDDQLEDWGGDLDDLESGYWERYFNEAEADYKSKILQSEQLDDERYTEEKAKEAQAETYYEAEHKKLTIYNEFERCKVQRLYHANTVTTACTFLSEGALLSRAEVERRRLPQTPQDSDKIDKEYGIWNDIFLDFFDVHDMTKMPVNIYGPVLFVFDVDVIASAENDVNITKKNPMSWDKIPVTERYYSDSELSASSLQISFGSSVVLANTPHISLQEIALKKIVLDWLPNDKFPNVYSEAKNALLNAAKAGQVDTDILVCRRCVENHTCISAYQLAPQWTYMAFMPEPKWRRFLKANGSQPPKPWRLHVR